jgi:hypothetical protein
MVRLRYGTMFWSVILTYWLLAGTELKVGFCQYPKNPTFVGGAQVAKSLTSICSKRQSNECP